MKLRIKGNDIRYRFTQSDVKRFGNEGRLEETISFAGQSLKYVLKETYDEQLSATFKNNMITLYMPVSFKNEWLQTVKVGYSNTFGDLFLLIEKDFKCLDDVAEDQSDNYPNPLVKN